MDGATGIWEPLSPWEVAGVLDGVACRWWIAGGWAIDLHLGRQSRAHADVDVLLMRPDQLDVQQHLAGWDLHVADPPGTLRPWGDGEFLGAGVHDVWCRRSPASPWALQLMVDDTERRVFSPDIQLLYKSAALRAKDEADFEAALAVLDASQRRWLRNSLAVATPGHPWLTRL